MRPYRPTYGIAQRRKARPGLHTVAVHYDGQLVHGNLLGSDVHLVRLDDGADPADVAAWMDWTQPGGLAEPAPAEFLGGLQDMPAGSTGYFTVLLQPGEYAWVAEVDDPASKGMLRTFSVPGGGV